MPSEPIDLDKLEALLAAAGISRPLLARDERIGDVLIEGTDRISAVNSAVYIHAYSVNIATFIAAFVNSCPAMIVELRRLRAQVKDVK